MEKYLTIKHLFGYLPYGLKVRVEDYKSDYVGREFDKVVGLHQWDKSGLLWSILTEGGAKPSIDKVKPILHPISDITDQDTIAFYDLDSVTLELIIISEWTKELIQELKFNNKFKLRQFEYLFSKHYDVYGLIELGWAIDINTLK